MGRTFNLSSADSSLGLNERLPDTFDLDEHIEPKGCCNAQLPGEA